MVCFKAPSVNLCPLLGPLTHTDKDGHTTLYGVVSGQGSDPDCKSTGIFARVSEPNVLKWIKKHIDLQ